MSLQTVEVVRCRRKQMTRSWRIHNPKPKARHADTLAALLGAVLFPRGNRHARR